MKRKIIYINALMLCAVMACGRQGGQRDSDDTNQAGPVVSETNSVKLTGIQAKTAGISMGAPVVKEVYKIISANGAIELQPNYKASVAPPATGYVVQINFLEGDHVQKGTKLAVLQDPDYIQMQQDFIEAYEKYSYLSKELNRQKILSQANVSALKQYQKTKVDYGTAKARYIADSEKLKFLGINPDSVKAGKIESIIYLRAPISGNISRVNIHKGELISPSLNAFEMTDNTHLYARLNIFEKDVDMIRKDEPFRFTVPAFSDSITCYGKIQGIGGILNPVTKSMDAIGSVRPTPGLMPGIYIEARIQTSPEKGYVLPDRAVVMDENMRYVFLYAGKTKEGSEGSRMMFKRVRIQTGITEDGFSQLLGPGSLLHRNNIVVSGAYYLNAQMNKGANADDDD